MRVCYGGLFFLLPVVVNLDSEDNGRACERYYVGDGKWPVVGEDALHHKEKRAEAHHQEGGHCDALGVAGADGGYGLGHVAENHAD